MRSIILPVVLHKHETWYLNYKVRVFENRMLKRIFGPRRDAWKIRFVTFLSPCRQIL
jgi:hypothetical protein